jgi:hypothetical protein
MRGRGQRPEQCVEAVESGPYAPTGRGCTGRRPQHGGWSRPSSIRGHVTPGTTTRAEPGLSVAQDPRSSRTRDPGHRHGAFGHANTFIPPAGRDAVHRHDANAPDQLLRLYRTRSPGPWKRSSKPP